MKMYVTANLENVEKRVSKKGNDYVVLRINQLGSFGYLNIMLDRLYTEKSYDDLSDMVGSEYTFNLDYNGKYKNFTIVGIE